MGMYPFLCDGGDIGIHTRQTPIRFTNNRTLLGLSVNRICTWLPRKGENINMKVGVIRKLHNRGRIQRKTWCMGPYAGVDYNLTLHVYSRVDSNTFNMGNPMPESTLTLRQSRL